MEAWWGRAGWWFRAVGLLAAAVGLATVACSNNDDKPDVSSETFAAGPAGDAPAEQVAATSTPMVPPTATPRPVGTDVEYVKGLCVAMEEFFGDVEAATQAITPTDPSGVAREFAAAFGPPLTRFKEDLNQIPPPADVMAWHDKMAENLGHIAAGIMAGEGLNEIARLGDRPLPDFPPEIQQRLFAAARATPECRLFEDTFSG